MDLKAQVKARSNRLALRHDIIRQNLSDVGAQPSSPKLWTELVAIPFGVSLLYFTFRRLSPEAKLLSPFLLRYLKAQLPL